MANRAVRQLIDGDVERIVVPRHRISERVRELAREIADGFKGEELTLLAVLTGSVIFLADLIRELPLRMRINLVSISSYPGPATQSQGPEFIAPVPVGLEGKHVLILDDILDSGRTLAALRAEVQKMNPADVRSCVLLAKRRPELADRIRADFVGFEVGPEFVVGYGLDFDNLYRNLPDICVLRRHVLSAADASPAEEEPR